MVAEVATVATPVQAAGGMAERVATVPLAGGAMGATVATVPRAAARAVRAAKALQVMATVDEMVPGMANEQGDK